MKCKCKVLSVNGVPASDGSIVPFEVMQSYIESQECKDSIEKHKMIGTLTHRSRNLQSTFPEKMALSKTVGKDDSMIIVSDQAPSPTHYISDLYIDGGWLWAEITLLNEEVMDDLAVQNIKRLKGMLKNGILPGVSAVIVGLWDNQKTGTDILRKLVNLKGIDITLNPSWKLAGIEEILEDDNEGEEKKFSEIEVEDFEFSGIKVKAFSSEGYTGPKSSKIDGVYTTLKIKEFSSCGTVTEIGGIAIDHEDDKIEEKQFSAAQVNERVRFAKLSPRERFRRLILDYRQSLKAQGGINKIEPEVLKIMKSLFESDLLGIMKILGPQIMSGKNLTALLNAGALGVEVRKACQALMIPYRQAMLEEKKMGFVSKQRYQKISKAYIEFVKSIEDYVFGVAPLEINEDEQEEK